MLSKTVDRTGRNWDECLPYVLFAYRTSVQESTQESPFHLLYGRDPYLPAEDTLAVPALRRQFEIGSYQEELVTHLQEAWKLARQNMKKAQRRQKRNYDRGAKPAPFRVGDSTAPSPTLEASVSNRNPTSKWGYANTGASVNVFFSNVKAAWHSADHWNRVSFLVRVKSGAAILENEGMNLL